MTTDDWYINWRNLDKEAMLHVEGRQPKLVCRDWPYKVVRLK